MSGFFLCHLARYRSGVWLSETPRLFSALTQWPSHPSEQSVLQPQPWGHLRLTPNCFLETFFWAAGSSDVTRTRELTAGTLLSEVLKRTSSANSLLWRMVAKNIARKIIQKEKWKNHKTYTCCASFLHCLLFHQVETQTDVNIHLQTNIWFTLSQQKIHLLRKNTKN